MVFDDAPGRSGWTHPELLDRECVRQPECSPHCSIVRLSRRVSFATPHTTPAPAADRPSRRTLALHQRTIAIRPVCDDHLRSRLQRTRERVDGDQIYTRETWPGRGQTPRGTHDAHGPRGKRCSSLNTCLTRHVSPSCSVRYVHRPWPRTMSDLRQDFRLGVCEALASRLVR